jgi:H/ACA ribonucleoprotein complex subunit 4
LNEGIVNINKPPGPTSTQVSDWVKTLLKANAAGHTGTLDPNVTGCLPVAINDATKVTSALLPAGKEYMTLMHLHNEVDEKEIKEVLKEFAGKIYQRPPTKSAVRKDLRIRTIYYNDILEINGKDVLFSCGCQGGTYIRKLCHDVGLALGCGAHMQQLRRTKTGPLTEKISVTLQELSDAYYFWTEKKDEKRLRKVLLPMESALTHLPKIFISDTCVEALCHGAQLMIPGISKLDSGISVGELVAVYTLKGEGVLLATAMMTSEDMKKKKKGQSVKTERVLMKTGVYPKYERKN